MSVPVRVTIILAVLGLIAGVWYRRAEAPPPPAPKAAEATIDKGYGPKPNRTIPRAKGARTKNPSGERE